MTSGWRDQLHAALIGLGYATREADEAIEAVAPQAEAEGARRRSASSSRPRSRR